MAGNQALSNSSKKYIHKLLQAFEENRDPENAFQMKKYVREQFDFYGIKSPERREIQKPFLIRENLPPSGDIRTVVYTLWNTPFRECQYAGMEILHKGKTPLDISDLPYLENLITTKSWWDTVDFLAPKIGGYILQKDPGYQEEVALKWMRSDNLWLQRSSLIFQLFYKEKTDADLLFRVIIGLKEHPDFFIRKAIGWSLRQFAKINPEEVRDFIGKTELSPLSYREASKHL